MANSIQSIALGRLAAHPGNPNRMSSSTFAKLIRNIERTGRYEPLIVRPYRRRHRESSIQDRDCFQIINGHHRWRALKQLGYDKADVIVWDVDDEQADIFLATLNRLAGSDAPAKRIALLKRLTEKMNARQLGKLLPQTPGQIKRLLNLKMPEAPVKAAASSFASPLVFFVNNEQQKIIETALSLARNVCHSERSQESGLHKKKRPEKRPRASRQTKAARNAAALTIIAQHFLDTAKHGHKHNED